VGAVLVRGGLTTGEISAHFAHIYGAQISKDTISRITDRVVEEMTVWHTRPLERLYAAVFIDALHVKIRYGQVGPRPIYAAIGVDLAGHRDVLGMWAGEGDGESSTGWPCSPNCNRGVADIFFLVCEVERPTPIGQRCLRRHHRADLHPPDLGHVPLRRPPPS
jgi:putative transposase